MILSPNDDPLLEVNHCHGTGTKGHPCEHAGTHKFLAKYPKYAPEVEAFGAKYGDDRLHADTDAHWSNMNRGSGIPSMEFQLEVMQGGNKRIAAERRAGNKTVAADRKAQVLAQMAQRGITVGQVVFDKESGRRGEVKIGRDGRPYVQSALGKHPLGTRWFRDGTLP
jgi:hypothetical protein